MATIVAGIALSTVLLCFKSQPRTSDSLAQRICISPSSLDLWVPSLPRYSCFLHLCRRRPAADPRPAALRPTTPANADPRSHRSAAGHQQRVSNRGRVGTGERWPTGACGMGSCGWPAEAGGLCGPPRGSSRWTGSSTPPSCTRTTMASSPIDVLVLTQVRPVDIRINFRRLSIAMPKPPSCSALFVFF